MKPWVWLLINAVTIRTMLVKGAPDVSQMNKSIYAGFSWFILNDFALAVYNLNQPI